MSRTRNTNTKVKDEDVQDKEIDDAPPIRTQYQTPQRKRLPRKKNEVPDSSMFSSFFGKIKEVFGNERELEEVAIEKESRERWDDFTLKALAGAAWNDKFSVILQYMQIMTIQTLLYTMKSKIQNDNQLAEDTRSGLQRLLYIAIAALLSTVIGGVITGAGSTFMG